GELQTISADARWRGGLARRSSGVRPDERGRAAGPSESRYQAHRGRGEETRAGAEGTAGQAEGGGRARAPGPGAGKRKAEERRAQARPDRREILIQSRRAFSGARSGDCSQGGAKG